MSTTDKLGQLADRSRQGVDRGKQIADQANHVKNLTREPDGRSQEKIATAKNATRVAASAAKGAAAGSLGGAATGAAKEAAKVAIENPKVQRRLLKTALAAATVIALTALALAMMMMNIINASSSTQSAGIRQRANIQAVDAGLDSTELGFVIDQADRYGIPWEVAAATYWTQQSATGAGPWKIVDDNADDVHDPGADDFTASTMWVLARMNEALADEPTLDRSLGLGDGSAISETGQVSWADEETRDTRIVQPYAKALAAMPLAGASEGWGKQIALAAIYWHAGQGAPCSLTGANYAMFGTPTGAWMQPVVDTDGTIGDAGDFGPRIHPVTGGTSMHNGVDLQSPEGAPIWAVSDGVVVFAQLDRDQWGGNTVRLDHGGGIQTEYQHMQSTFQVAAGDQVTVGQPIGQVGMSGTTSGPHLHFEVHVNGTPVDPEVFFAERGIDLTKPVEANNATVINPTPTPAPTPAGDTAAVTNVALSTEPAGSAPGDSATSSTNPATLTSRDASGTTWTFDKTQIDNAALIIGVGESLSADPKVIQAALATAMVESTLKQLASNAVPESLTYPNDGVASGDTDSIGLFQQRATQGTWGTIAQIMDKTYTTQMFYGGPSKPNPSGPPGALDIITSRPELLDNPGALAQAVQVSALPDRYATMLPVAADLIAAVSGTLVPGGGSACNAGMVNGAAGATFYGNNLPKSDRNVGSTQNLQPVAAAALQAVAAEFPEITTIGGWRPSDAINPDGHPAGKAIDVMIPNYATPAGVALGERVAAFAQTNHEALGLDYIIWNQRIWSVARASEGWRPMSDRGSDTQNHKDHVHINFP